MSEALEFPLTSWVSIRVLVIFSDVEALLKHAQAGSPWQLACHPVTLPPLPRFPTWYYGPQRGKVTPATPCQ